MHKKLLFFVVGLVLLSSGLWQELGAMEQESPATEMQDLSVGSGGQQETDEMDDLPKCDDGMHVVLVGPYDDATEYINPTPKFIGTRVGPHALKKQLHDDRVLYVPRYMAQQVGVDWDETPFDFDDVVVVKTLQMLLWRGTWRAAQILRQACLVGNDYQAAILKFAKQISAAKIFVAWADLYCQRQIVELFNAVEKNQVDAIDGLLQQLSKAIEGSCDYVVPYEALLEISVGQAGYFETNGVTPLHWAALCGHLEMVSKLLACGADVNARSRRKNIPLHCAVATNVDVVTVLLKHGADVTYKNSAGRTAEEEARATGHVAIADFIRYYKPA